MTTAQVVQTSVTVNNNSPIQDYIHPDDQTQPNFELSLSYFVSSSCMFLDEKTLLKIWPNSGLNLTIFRGTRPQSLR